MKVEGSNGFVEVEIKGVAEAIAEVRKEGQDIINGVEANAFQAANFLQQEIQSSIIGMRGEERSVDTGNYANSIKIVKLQDGVFSIETDVEYAKYLEYGTSDIDPRPHFRNSVDRNRKKVFDIIKG